MHGYIWLFIIRMVIYMHMVIKWLCIMHRKPSRLMQLPPGSTGKFGRPSGLTISSNDRGSNKFSLLSEHLPCTLFASCFCNENFSLKDFDYKRGNLGR